MTDVAPVVMTDPQSIARYINVVFSYLDGFVPIRLLSETGTASQPPKQEFPQVPDAAALVQRLAPVAAKAKRGIYVVPGTVHAPGSARAEDIAETGVVVIDLDAGDMDAKRVHLERHLGAATLVVESGGRTEEGQPKLHLYWRLTEAARDTDLEVVRAVREMIAQKAGGDASFGSLHQPIRVAGSVHGKLGRMTPVRIIADSGLEYDLGELATAAAAMAEMPGPPKIATVAHRPKGASAAELATRRIRAGGVDGTTRFDAMSSIIGHWIRTARRGLCTIDAAWEAVSDHNAAQIDPPWEKARLRQEFVALLKRDIKNHGPMPKGRAIAHTADVSTPPPFSDDALAADFVDMQGSDWRHVAAWGVWFHWNGCHWVRDEKKFVREAVRQVCREAAGVAEKPQDARRIASDKTIAAVLRLAAADPRIATQASDWDAHPHLLNTPSGVVDLTTGEEVAHARDLLISQITAAKPGEGCPRWRSFLDEVTGGDQDLQSYLARLAGYCLTGLTKEQMFAFIFGPGGNGKSVFVQTLAAVMGDYAATATLDTFMSASVSRHLTELAGLRAARIVVVPETEAGRAWAEGRIKSVTGGESIRANYMHKDHFEFKPQFKLVVMGNHRPSLSQVNEAMRRRLHLVPFDVVIPEANRDRGLGEALWAERDGILGWMLDGCAEWQRHCLNPPTRMLDEARDYFSSEDLYGQWIEACCTVGPTQVARSSALFKSWSAWAEAEGHISGSARALAEALRLRGCRDGKISRDRGWTGIAVRRLNDANLEGGQ